VANIEKGTIQYYDKHAEQWAVSHEGDEEFSYWQHEMGQLHERLPTGRLLEIGCGPGRDAAALTAMGYDYVGTDASSGFLKVAQRRNPTSRFLHMAVQDLEFPEGYFDGFWGAAVVLHIPKKSIDASLERIGHVVRRDGIGFISLIQGEGERADTDGRWRTFYQQDEFDAILRKNSFRTIEETIRPEARKTWLTFLVKNGR
jgi:SAM-dependent methyltransferase